jgi:hypothetical protein
MPQLVEDGEEASLIGPVEPNVAIKLDVARIE